MLTRDGRVIDLEQLQDCIGYLADTIGLTYNEALEHAWRRALPDTPTGIEIYRLVMMLPRR